MPAYKVSIVLDSRGPNLKADVPRIQEELEKDPRLQIAVVERQRTETLDGQRPTSGRLCAELYLGARNHLQAGATAYLALEAALERAGFNRATTVVENAVYPGLGAEEVARPKVGLRQLGYAA